MRCEKRKGARVSHYCTPNGGHVWICNDCGKVVAGFQ